jgi:hypothetical protein
MYGTVAAGAFVFLERAVLQSMAGVREEYLAFVAECFARTAVLVFAESPDHQLHRSVFTLHSF